MLVVQQNCGKSYECTLMTLKAGLGLNAELICIQKLFLGKRSISHPRFNLYWPPGIKNWKDMQVLIVVRKDVLSKVVVKNWTDVVSYLYCIVVDIREPYPQARKKFRKTKMVNLYDNKFGNR